MKISLKKAVLVTGASFFFLLICSLVAYVLRFFKLEKASTPLFIGLAILAVSGVLVIFAKDRLVLNIPVFFLSAIAFGFCLRSWYIFRVFDNSVFTMLAVAACATAYLWLFYLLLKIPFFAKHPIAYAVIYLLLTLAAYLFVMLNTKTTYVSTFGYYIIVQIAFIYAMYSDADDARGIIHSFAISTFSVFGAVAFAAALIAMCVLGGDGDCDCEPDCCECFDCVNGIGNGKKNSKRT